MTEEDLSEIMLGFSDHLSVLASRAMFSKEPLDVMTAAVLISIAAAIDEFFDGDGELEVEVTLDDCEGNA